MKPLRREQEELISAGIDIGTSTTKLIISRLSLANTAGLSHVPRIEIIDKQVLYKSPIYRTPLESDSRIDMGAVLELVEQEYRRAGIHPRDIATGAVIITGETATKQNAEEMVHQLSERAGEFLVATAGPDLEGIIAAKGSGAYEYSRQTGRTVANIDIGGGTANIAVYRSGHLLGTCTLHIGGRLIEFHAGQVAHGEKVVKRISSPVRDLLHRLGLRLIEGEPAPRGVVEEIVQAMVRTLSHILDGRVEPGDEILLLGHPPDWTAPVEAIMFSGGVSECLYGLEQNGRESLLNDSYADIGLILARVLAESAELTRWEWIKPLETVRATVLGAGMQTTEISGATIHVDRSCLPIKNLPVYHVDMNGSLADGRQKIHTAIEKAIRIYDPAGEGRSFALYLTGLPVLRFREVRELADWLLSSYRQPRNHKEPIVIIVSSDMAKVLGQTLQSMNPGHRILCIDQVQVEQGDYVDIGHMLQTEVVPVVVKTLTFHSSERMALQ